ncbi:family 2 glycosyl transferase [Alishewanella jeotgali KCTC 22429]|uniref:Family 2 glycosyl transferase n=1 Tax=Alishewanella jeotgali KCTC 22429 TaxID=1129374 RepID=H3ZB89_9ALTE|nr:family 2 glycosyl transferase [Alishewanella jeotgali KCTC 22429]
MASVTSVLTQDYPNIEVIVVDDGSTDNSLEVLKTFTDKITIITQQNQGPAAARNAGIRAANGKYIAFNDGDDIWLPRKVTVQVDYLESHPETGLCYSSWRVWNQQVPLSEFMANIPVKSNPAELVSESSGWLYTKLLRMSLVCTITAMIRTDIVREVGLFDLNYLIGEDHDYWIRVSRLCKIDKLAGIFAIYRVNPNSTTKKVHSQNYSLNVLTSALEKYGLACPSGQKLLQSDVNRYLGARHFHYGYNAMVKGYREIAYSSFKACLKLRYRFFKALFFTVICSTNLTYSLFHKESRNI